MAQDEGVRRSGSADSTERQGATLANAVADGLFQVDAEDRLVAVNDALLDAVGRSREELIGASLDRAFPSADAERLSTARRGLIESEPDTVTLPATLPTADEGSRQCEIRLRLVEGTGGGAAGSVRLSAEATEANDDPAEAYEDVLGRTQEELHAETEKFRSLVDAVEEYAICMLDPDGRVTSWNQGAKRIKGYDAEEVLGEHSSLFYTDEDQAAGVPEGNLAEAAETGQVEDEGWRVRADGSRFWANVVITPVRDDDGRLSGYAKVTRDMTERREAEEAIRRERNLVTQILETSPVGIALVDEDNELVRTNDRAAEFAGRMPEELLELSATEIELYDEDGEVVPPEEHPSRRALESGESVIGGEFQVELPDGKRQWLTINASVIEGANEARVVLAVQDITSLKRREAQLRQERDLTEQILNANPVGIAVMDRSGEITRLNDSGAAVLGVEPEHMDRYDPGDWAVFDEDGTRVPPPEWPQSHALRTGEAVFDWRCEIESPDGTRRWVSANVVPIRDEAGSVERIILTANDITPIKRREADLRRERDLTERILETSPVGIGVLSAGDEIEYINDRGQEILGIDTATPDPASDDYGQLLDEAGNPIPDEERPSARAFSTGEQVSDWQCQYDHPDGGLRWLSMNSTPVYDEDGEVERVITVGDDITQLKEQARQLERQRDDLASELDEMFRRIDDAFYAVDDQFRFTYVNERAEKFLRHEEGQLLGRSVWEVFPEATETAAWESFHEALERQEPTSYEVYFDPLDFWVEANVYPSETGLSVYFRDVTERKERERELETYETIVKTVDDGVYVCDEEFRFTMVNDAYVEMTGYDREELLGAHASLVVGEDVSAESAERLQEIASGEATSAAIEADIHRADGSRLRAESKFTNIPSDDADHLRKVGVVRDVTERKERERALEESRNRYQALVENFPNGAVALVDQDLRYKTVGGTPIRESNATVAQLEGSRVDEILPPNLADLIVPHYVDALDGEPSAFEQEIGDRIFQFWTLPVHNDSGDVFAALGMSQDITERKERERALEESERRYRTLVEHFPNGTVALFDDDLRYTAVGGELIEQLDLTPEDVIGDLITERYPDDLVERIEPYFRAALEGESSTFEAELYGLDLYAHTLPVRNADDEVYAGMLVVQDVTELRERERELERYETIVEAVNDGIYVVDEQARFTMVNGEYASMTGYTREELVGADVSLVVDDSTAGQAQVVQKEMADGESDSATLEADIRTADGGLVPAEATFALMETDDTVERIGVARDITERKERERALKRQREELAALNRLNQAVGEITHATVESSSREEIERLVCERLADSESYLFAWVGEVDRPSGTVALRTEAGVEGYLDNVTLAVDPADGNDGPTARAVRTLEPQVVRDTEAESIYEPWREVASEYGFRSSAAIPITYEDVLYGVLNVYSRRPGAFDGYERTLLARLGNIVGHAINALERKEALMSDQIQEIDLEIPAIDALAEASIPTEGTITFERTVAVGDGAYLQYGTADREAMALLEGLVESLSFWEELTILEERFDPVSFQLRLSEPPAISTAATYGGRIQSATIENGTYRMRVELPPAADVRVVIEALQGEYPGLELVAQRRTTRDTQSIRQIDDVLEERLTDRQRTVLETAYYAGYFDTPRKRSGEAVAESLDITAPTLHQHLRKGQRKLLSTVFDDSRKELYS